jgi:hypothetical protein
MGLYKTLTSAIVKSHLIRWANFYFRSRVNISLLETNSNDRVVRIDYVQLLVGDREAFACAKAYPLRIYTHICVRRQSLVGSGMTHDDIIDTR